MKCRHGGRGYEWHECPECGKMIRVSRWRGFARAFFAVLHLAFGADAVADYAIERLGLAGRNPHNVTHAIIGGVSIMLVYLLLYRLFPFYDEKQGEQANGEEGAEQ